MGFMWWDPTYMLVLIGAVICMIASVCNVILTKL